MSMTDEEHKLISFAIGVLHKHNPVCAEVVEKLLFEYAKLLGKLETK